MKKKIYTRWYQIMDKGNHIFGQFLSAINEPKNGAILDKNGSPFYVDLDEIDKIKKSRKYKKHFTEKKPILVLASSDRAALLPIIDSSFALLFFSSIDITNGFSIIKNDASEASIRNLNLWLEAAILD